MILAVASGKGGTGKTTVAVNLARAIGTRVQLLDCDVEEPNIHLFLAGEISCQEPDEPVAIRVPQVDASLCDACGECSRFCEYNAIVCLETGPLVFAQLCHGCGGCTRICPRGAISEIDRRIGVVSAAQAGNISLVEGRLDVGVAMAPPLVRAVKARMGAGLPTIVDAPPGTSCPAIAAVQGSDMVVLVTEPTPFGLHDLTLAVDMVRALGIPFGVVINRVGAGDDRVDRYCKAVGVPVLAGIPDDRRIAEVYSRGDLVVEALPEYRACFDNLLDRTLRMPKPAGD
jgi:MinD superfamily P-loop ATPase